MSWRYCEECNHKLNAPTIREIIENDKSCFTCGTSLDLSADDYQKEVLLDLLDRIELLEGTVNNV